MKIIPKYQRGKGFVKTSQRVLNGRTRFKGAEKLVNAALMPEAQSSVSSTKRNSENVFYRKMNAGQLSRILENNGIISPLSKEGPGLHFVKGKPRKSPYYLKVNDVPIEQTIEGKAFSLFGQKRLSPQYVSTSTFRPVLGVDAQLFKKVGNKYIAIENPYTDLVDERVIQSMKPANFNLGLMTKRAGSELKISPHQIQINDLEKPIYDEHNIPLSDDPYTMAGIVNPAKLKALNYRDPHYHSNASGDRTFSELSYSDSEPPLFYVSDTSQTGVQDPLYETIRKYIQNAGKVDPIFNTGSMHTALLSHYKNNFDIDLSGLSLEERAAFMQKLVNESKGQLLFHSTNHPITKWDTSKLGANTGNQGFYGRGLYLNDVPNQDYGLILQPILVNGAQRKAVITSTTSPRMEMYNEHKYLASAEPPKYRLTSPFKKLDDLLADISDSVVDYKGDPLKMRTYNWPLISKRDGFDKWNQLLKDYDIIYATPSSKGGGVFSEILLPENTNATIKSLFPPPDKIGKPRIWDDGEFLKREGGKIRFKKWIQ